MTKKLTRHGNSLALVIDKPILELLKIDADTVLEVSTDGQRLIVARPAPPRRTRTTLTEALREVHEEFGRALKRLAE